MNEPLDDPTGESRTRIRKPSEYVLDVVEQRERRLLDQLVCAAGGQRTGDIVEQGTDLAVHDDGVQAFLAAEVLVDDRLGDLGAGRDLLDRGRLVPPLGEQATGDRR